MFFIIVYDIASPKRLPKILKICRKYLQWVQNSVFEGELTKREYDRLKLELDTIVNKKEDSVIFYKIRNEEVLNKKILGINKNENPFFI